MTGKDRKGRAGIFRRTMASMELPALPAATVNPHTELAQHYLATAFDSVEALIETLSIIKRARETEDTYLGQYADPEGDIVRAVLVFAGAGIDAALKQLVRDALPKLLDGSKVAAEKLERFIQSNLERTSEGARFLARALSSSHSRQVLIEEYIADLTGGSLQSTEELQRLAGALGIDDPSLRTRIRELQPLFKTRNHIVHELDLHHPRDPKGRIRRRRNLDEAIALTHQGLSLTQLLINSVAERLGT